MLSRDIIGVILAAKRGCAENARALLLDDMDSEELRDITRLSEKGISPDELWTGISGIAPRSLGLAVISVPRTAKDLFAVLSLVECFVANAGVILICPYATEAGPENRFEATEAFLGVNRGWERKLLAGNVVELKRVSDAAEPTQFRTGKVLAGTDTWTENRVHPIDSAKKRVISLAVFGQGHYWNYLPAFVRAHHTLFPGYELWIHHDDAIDKSLYGRTLRKLEARNIIKLIWMEHDGLKRGKCRSMLWRMAPAWDNNVEYVFPRDLDSLPMWRERCCVEEFILSGKALSSLHDAGAHAGVMGGLCGFRAPNLRALAPTFEDFVNLSNFSDETFAVHGSDQNFLNGKILPKLSTYGHSLRIEGHNRDAAMGGIQYVTEIAAPSLETVASVSEIVRQKSDSLAPYMGSAGYPVEEAIAFYDQHCPIINLIKKAEEE